MANRIPLVVDTSTNRLAELPTYDTLYLNPSDISANSFIGDGSQLSNIVSATSNTANYANFAGTAFSVSGSNVSGPVAFATTANSVAGANVSGQVAFANIATTANLAITANTVTTNAQPNITSLGTLTSLSVSGNVDPVNVNLVKFDENVQASSNASGTITPNMNLGSVHHFLLTGNITLNALANAAPGASATLVLTQDAVGNRLLTSNWKYAGNIKTLTTTANAVDIICVLYDGANYWASLTKGYV